MQRYDIPIAVHESCRKKIDFTENNLYLPPPSVTLVTVVTVLERLSHTPKTLLYLYINIELFFDSLQLIFGTVTTVTL